MVAREQTRVPLLSNHIAGTEFFERAKLAQQLSQRDAIEVFYIAVILGFRGLYGMPNSPFEAQQHQLPIAIEDWVKRTSGLIQLQHGTAEVPGVAIPVEGAPALENRFTLIGAMLLTIILTIVAAVIGYNVFLSECGIVNLINSLLAPFRWLLALPADGPEFRAASWG